MSENTQLKSLTPKKVTILFAVLLVAGLAINVLYYFKLAELRKRQTVVQSNLEDEKPISNMLDSLDSEFKRYESEYQLLEHGLKQLYETNCTKLSEFVPVIDDRIVACRNKKTRRGHSYEAMIHVPETGNHRLTIEAIKSSSSDILNYRHEYEEITYSESFSLEPGSNHSVVIFSSNFGKREIGIKLSGQKTKYIDFPFRALVSSGVRGLDYERTIMSPNQYPAIPISDQTKFWFGSIAFHSATRGPRGGPELLQVRLAIDSDGPSTSLPDDLLVVRKLLGDYESGVKPKFVFNSEGMYEFNHATN